MTILTFEHLTNEALFNSVKREFLLGDERYRNSISNEDNLKVDLDENNIITFKETVTSIKRFKSKSFDSELNKEIELENETYETEVEEVTLNFANDFLIPKINELTNSYEKSFVKEIKSRNLYSSSQIENFSKIGLRGLSLKRTQIEEAKHLDINVKEAALNSIDDIYDYVDNDFYQSHINIPKKIPFNFNKNQVIGLFYLLYENEYISHDLGITDLFRLVEEKCFYFDFSTNSHKDIKRANKIKNSLFGSKPDKSPETTISELEKIFNKDFFSL